MMMSLDCTFAKNILKRIRNVVSVVVSVVVGILIYHIGEKLNWVIHPYTEGIDMSDREEVKSHLNTQPLSLWVTILVVWSLGSLLAGYLIKYICKTNNVSLPLITGCILTIVGTKNLFMLPHPVWFTTASFFAFIPFVLLGFSMLKAKSRKRRG
jgi:hypothetical protein